MVVSIYRENHGHLQVFLGSMGSHGVIYLGNVDAVFCIDTITKKYI
jgi:hypothetical protein